MNTDEMTLRTDDRCALVRGQKVHVRAGDEDLGAGTIDDFTDDGGAVWVIFGGATPRRMFIPEDEAEFIVVPSDAAS